MRAFLFAISTALLVAACGQPPATPEAPVEAPATAGVIEVSEAWGTPTPGGTPISAGYLEIANGTAEEDRLIAVSSPRAPRVELHEMSMDGGVMRMRAVEGGLAVAAGERVTLAPGGLHLMFYDAPQPFVVGESIPVTLTFANVGEVSATLTIRTPSAASPEHSGH
ncbi:copper chaperone PCu(A)C [Terricaulis sp.]|uniref:copper chaperone PCu(A)C n=1 Tax=Terricaulis sp. TaxID=2768686 RepID=UPI002AC75F8E|nr:copper chaperone PCu(A)C [Terricaulis sp.]MDZ4690333.1 copper chaperone PCu(A)C [Terricaulis sp.]